MKKFLLLSVAVLFTFVLFACTTSDDNGDDTPGTTPLVIYQNKVEIDDVLSAYAEAWGLANDVEVQVRTCGGDACGYADQIIAEFNAANQPDIFVFEGLGQFLQYQNKIMPLDGEEWIDYTDVAFVYDGTVYGFPVNFEGWGMAYNADMLAAAGVDPASLVNRAAYATAFQAIADHFADDENFNAPVSMAAGPGLTWVTGLHNFNGYLSSGLDYDDRTVIDNLLNGVADNARLEALADWVELLFDYAALPYLTEGSYDDMINNFKLQRTAFVHQGNWIDPNLLQDGGIDFEVGYAPHASGLGDVDSIFVGAPSYYAVNPDGNNPELAKQFLNDMAMTEAGHQYMVVDAGYVPAFTNVELIPTGPLSAAVYEWSSEGNIYAWWQNDMPPGFGMDDLGPVYFQFAQGQIDKEQFIQRIRSEIMDLAD
ncbi:MAG: carbohydrate ABC transporter substrate-binding protein [Acholeplasmatales bacterium]|nr:MAG: carbohydrate ABC transporter substrate-binding protein [Acholeplasmatales bacterium]